MKPKKFPILVILILVTVKCNVSTSNESPVLIKILQAVDVATSDEHLFDVTTQLLKSLCICMHETLKVKEEKLLFNGESISLPIVEQQNKEKVLEIYRKIYNNTCFNLRQELADQFRRGQHVGVDEDDRQMDKSCANYERNYISFALRKKENEHDIKSNLESILYETLVETNDLHNYTINKSNIFRKPTVLAKNIIQQNVIVLISLSPKINLELNKEPEETVVYENLRKMVITNNTRVDIDIYNTIFYDKSLENNNRIEKVTSCNLLSLYTFLIEKKCYNQINVFKLLNKKDSVKMYIDITANKSQNDFLTACCKNNTDLCRKGKIKEYFNTQNTEYIAKDNNHHPIQNYKDTILKIKQLVKLYGEKIKRHGNFSNTTDSECIGTSEEIIDSDNIDLYKINTILRNLDQNSTKNPKTIILKNEQTREMLLDTRDLIEQSQMKDTVGNDLSSLDSLEESNWIHFQKSHNKVNRTKKYKSRRKNKVKKNKQTMTLNTQKDKIYENKLIVLSGSKDKSEPSVLEPPMTVTSRLIITEKPRMTIDHISTEDDILTTKQTKKATEKKTRATSVETLTNNIPQATTIDTLHEPTAIMTEQYSTKNMESITTSKIPPISTRIDNSPTSRVIHEISMVLVGDPVLKCNNTNTLFTISSTMQTPMITNEKKEIKNYSVTKRAKLLDILSKSALSTSSLSDTSFQSKNINDTPTSLETKTEGTRFRKEIFPSKKEVDLISITEQSSKKKEPSVKFNGKVTQTTVAPVEKTDKNVKLTLNVTKIGSTPFHWKNHEIPNIINSPSSLETITDRDSLETQSTSINENVISSAVEILSKHIIDEPLITNGPKKITNFQVIKFPLKLTSKMPTTIPFMETSLAEATLLLPQNTEKKVALTLPSKTVAAFSYNQTSTEPFISEAKAVSTQSKLEKFLLSISNEIDQSSVHKPRPKVEKMLSTSGEPGKQPTKNINEMHPRELNVATIHNLPGENLSIRLTSYKKKKPSLKKMVLYSNKRKMNTATSPKYQTVPALTTEKRLTPKEMPIQANTHLITKKVGIISEISTKINKNTYNIQNVPSVTTTLPNVSDTNERMTSTVLDNKGGVDSLTVLQPIKTKRLSFSEIKFKKVRKPNSVIWKVAPTVTGNVMSKKPSPPPTSLVTELSTAGIKEITSNIAFKEAVSKTSELPLTLTIEKMQRILTTSNAPGNTIVPKKSMTEIQIIINNTVDTTSSSLVAPEVSSKRSLIYFTPIIGAKLSKSIKSPITSTKKMRIVTDRNTNQQITTSATIDKYNKLLLSTFKRSEKSSKLNTKILPTRSGMILDKKRKKFKNNSEVLTQKTPTNPMRTISSNNIVISLSELPDLPQNKYVIIPQRETSNYIILKPHNSVASRGKKIMRNFATTHMNQKNDISKPNPVKDKFMGFKQRHNSESKGVINLSQKFSQLSTMQIITKKEKTPSIFLTTHVNQSEIITKGTLNTATIATSIFTNLTSKTGNRSAYKPDNTASAFVIEKPVRAHIIDFVAKNQSGNIAITKNTVINPIPTDIIDSTSLTPSLEFVDATSTLTSTGTKNILMSRTATNSTKKMPTLLSSDAIKVIKLNKSSNSSFISKKILRSMSTSSTKKYPNFIPNDASKQITSFPSKSIERTPSSTYLTTKTLLINMFPGTTKTTQNVLSSDIKEKILGRRINSLDNTNITPSFTFIENTNRAPTLPSDNNAKQSTQTFLNIANNTKGFTFNNILEKTLDITSTGTTKKTLTSVISHFITKKPFNKSLISAKKELSKKQIPLPIIYKKAFSSMSTKKKKNRLSMINILEETVGSKSENFIPIKKSTPSAFFNIKEEYINRNVTLPVITKKYSSLTSGNIIGLTTYSDIADILDKHSNLTTNFNDTKETTKLESSAIIVKTTSANKIKISSRYTNSTIKDLNLSHIRKTTKSFLKQPYFDMSRKNSILMDTDNVEKKIVSTSSQASNYRITDLHSSSTRAYTNISFLNNLTTRTSAKLLSPLTSTTDVLSGILQKTFINGPLNSAVLINKDVIASSYHNQKVIKTLSKPLPYIFKTPTESYVLQTSSYLPFALTIPADTVVLKTNHSEKHQQITKVLTTTSATMKPVNFLASRVTDVTEILIGTNPTDNLGAFLEKKISKQSVKLNTSEFIETSAYSINGVQLTQSERPTIHVISSKNSRTTEIPANLTVSSVMMEPDNSSPSRATDVNENIIDKKRIIKFAIPTTKTSNSSVKPMTREFMEKPVNVSVNLINEILSAPRNTLSTSVNEPPFVTVNHDIKNDLNINSYSNSTTVAATKKDLNLLLDYLMKKSSNSSLTTKEITNPTIKNKMVLKSKTLLTKNPSTKTPKRINKKHFKSKTKKTLRDVTKNYKSSTIRHTVNTFSYFMSTETNRSKKKHSKAKAARHRKKSSTSMSHKKGSPNSVKGDLIKTSPIESLMVTRSTKAASESTSNTWNNKLLTTTPLTIISTDWMENTVTESSFTSLSHVFSDKPMFSLTNLNSRGFKGKFSSSNEINSTEKHHDSIAFPTTEYLQTLITELVDSSESSINSKITPNSLNLIKTLIKPNAAHPADPSLITPRITTLHESNLTKIGFAVKYPGTTTSVILNDPSLTTDETLHKLSLIYSGIASNDLSITKTRLNDSSLKPSDPSLSTTGRTLYDLTSTITRMIMTRTDPSLTTADMTRNNSISTKTDVPADGLSFTTTGVTRNDPISTITYLRANEPSLITAKIILIDPISTTINVTVNDPSLTTTKVTPNDQSLRIIRITQNDPSLATTRMAVDVTRNYSRLTTIGVTGSERRLTTTTGMTANKLSLTTSRMVLNPSSIADGVDAIDPSLTTAKIALNDSRTVDATENDLSLVTTSMTLGDSSLITTEVSTNNPSSSTTKITLNDPILTSRMLLNPSSTANGVNANNRSLTTIRIILTDPSLTTTDMTGNTPTLTTTRVTPIHQSSTKSRMTLNEPSLTTSRVIPNDSRISNTTANFPSLITAGMTPSNSSLTTTRMTLNDPRLTITRIILNDQNLTTAKTILNDSRTTDVTANDLNLIKISMIPSDSGLTTTGVVLNDQSSTTTKMTLNDPSSTTTRKTLNNSSSTTTRMTLNNPSLITDVTANDLSLTTTEVTPNFPSSTRTRVILNDPSLTTNAVPNESSLTKTKFALYDTTITTSLKPIIIYPNLKRTDRKLNDLSLTTSHMIADIHKLTNSLTSVNAMEDVPNSTTRTAENLVSSSTTPLEDSLNLTKTHVIEMMYGSTSTRMTANDSNLKTITLTNDLGSNTTSNMINDNTSAITVRTTANSQTSKPCFTYSLENITKEFKKTTNHNLQYKSSTSTVKYIPSLATSNITESDSSLKIPRIADSLQSSTKTYYAGNSPSLTSTNTISNHLPVNAPALTTVLATIDLPDLQVTNMAANVPILTIKSNTSGSKIIRTIINATTPQTITAGYGSSTINGLSTDDSSLTTMLMSKKSPSLSSINILGVVTVVATNYGSEITPRTERDLLNTQIRYTSYKYKQNNISTANKKPKTPTRLDFTTEYMNNTSVNLTIHNITVTNSLIENDILVTLEPVYGNKKFENVTTSRIPVKTRILFNGNLTDDVLIPVNYLTARYTVLSDKPYYLDLDEKSLQNTVLENNVEKINKSISETEFEEKNNITLLSKTVNNSNDLDYSSYSTKPTKTTIITESYDDRTKNRVVTFIKNVIDLDKINNVNTNIVTTIDENASLNYKTSMLDEAKITTHYIANKNANKLQENVSYITDKKIKQMYSNVTLALQNSIKNLTNVTFNIEVTTYDNTFLKGLENVKDYYATHKTEQQSSSKIKNKSKNENQFKNIKGTKIDEYKHIRFIDIFHKGNKTYANSYVTEKRGINDKLKKFKYFKNRYTTDNIFGLNSTPPININSNITTINEDKSVEYTSARSIHLVSQKKTKRIKPESRFNAKDKIKNYDSKRNKTTHKHYIPKYSKKSKVSETITNRFIYSFVTKNPNLELSKSKGKVTSNKHYSNLTEVKYTRNKLKKASNIKPKEPRGGFEHHTLQPLREKTVKYNTYQPTRDVDLLISSEKKLHLLQPLKMNKKIKYTKNIIEATTPYYKKKQNPTKPMFVFKATEKRITKTDVKPPIAENEFKNQKLNDKINPRVVGINYKMPRLQDHSVVPKTIMYPVTDWWLDDMYMKVRLPLTINSNPGMVFPRRTFHKMEEVADLGALFIDDLLDYKEMLDKGELPLERATSREKGQPLCMEQFYCLLGVCRIPEVGRDRLEFPAIKGNADEGEELVIAACRNYFYPIPVKASDRGRLTPGEIQAQLLHCMVDAAGAPPAPRVGLLTSMNRDQWARARETLIKDENNRTNLELISRALCLLCLDEAGGDRTDTDADTNAMLRAMHGAGTRYHSANRWFDKTVQLIISQDGTIGMCYEHSAAEGVAVVRLAERALARAEVADRPAPPPALLPAPQAMKWNIPLDVHRTIEQAARELDRAISDLDHRVYTYRGYGREYMKSCRTSPDVYIQLALQYAYYKMYGYLVTTYESASLRRFRNGRVDNIRSAHAAAHAWAAAMCTAETPPLNEANDDGQKKVSFNLYGDQKKLELFEEAARKQTEIMEANILGHGIDNHLLGLREAARETLGELPPVFTDATYKQMIEFKLSTSQVATTTDGTFMGYGAVVLDGYGCSYNPNRDSIIFCISSFTSSSVTNTEAFRQSLEEALNSMQLMFQTRTAEA